MIRGNDWPDPDPDDGPWVIIFGLIVAGLFILGVWKFIQLLDALHTYLT